MYVFIFKHVDAEWNVQIHWRLSSNVYFPLAIPSKLTSLRVQETKFYQYKQRLKLSIYPN